MPSTPSVEPVVRSRLLPRISFRAMMVWTTVSAIVLAIAHSANQGGVYASAAALGIMFLLGTLIVLAVVFLLAWAVAKVRRPVGAALMFFSFAMIVLSAYGMDTGWTSLPIVLVNTGVVGIFLMFVPAPKRREDHLDSPFAADRLPPQILPPRDAQT